MEHCKELSYCGRKHIPIPSGPYGVGCTDIMTQYTKSGSFFRLFYPIVDSNAQNHYLKWANWIPSEQYVDGLATHMDMNPTVLHFIKYLFVGDTFIPAQWQAPLIQKDGCFPVIIFSHGLSAWRNTNSTICLEIASYGFVVAAVEHRDNSASASYYLKQQRTSMCGEFPGSSLDNVNEILERESISEWEDALNGQWDPRPAPQIVGPPTTSKEWVCYKKVDLEQSQYIRKEQVNKRVQECRHVIEILEKMNKGLPINNVIEPNFQADAFKGRLDLSKMAIMGHSFGGATALLALTAEPQFKMGIALDPWMYPIESDMPLLEKIERPILVINSHSFQTEKYLQLLKRMKAVEFMCNIRDAGHKDLTDSPFIGSILLPWFQGRWSRELGFRTHALISDMTMQFLSKHFGVQIKYPGVDEFVKETFVENVNDLLIEA